MSLGGKQSGDEQRRAFHFEDMVQQSAIITAFVKEPGIKVGMPVTFNNEQGTVFECTVIKKIGRQVKLRIEKIAVRKAPL